jgi:hypothetical protein
MGKLLGFCKKNYEYLTPIIHFFISFIWEKTIFIYSNNWEVSNMIARTDEAISDRAELAIVYILSRIFSLVIIWLIWKLIFYIVRGNISKKYLIVIGTIFVIGMAIGIILYPESFGIEVDNYTNYAEARRFIPTYWQSVYTGALYAGCLMVIPHPIAIFFFQWLLFCVVVGYIVVGSKSYIPLLLFLLPESYYLAFNAYRNNYYASLIMFYISWLYFGIKRQTQNRKPSDNVKFVLLTAFIMVWRSEGILIGFGGLLVYLLFFVSVKKANVKKGVFTLVLLVASFCGLNKIQSIGSDKYYGQDYMILNTASVLYSIFNDPNVDLDYSGAADDLQAIGSVVPVEVLKEGQYSNYNWTNGHLDFNQTLASDSTADAYMKAYYRIVSHNLTTYMDVQINKFYSSIQLPESRTTYEYTGDSALDLDQFVYDSWTVGYFEIRETVGTTWWEQNPIRVALKTIVSEGIIFWRELIINSGINAILHVCAILFVCIICGGGELLKWIGDGKKERIGFIIASLVIIGEILAVLMFMPEGRAAYMYPMLYASYLLIYYRKTTDL